MITVSFTNPSHTPNPTFSLNGTSFTNAIALLQTQATNSFIATNISNYGSPTVPGVLTFGNIDTNKSPSINVSNCVAAPMLNAQ